MIESLASIPDKELYSDAMGEPGTADRTYPGMIRANAALTTVLEHFNRVVILNRQLIAEAYAATSRSSPGAEPVADLVQALPLDYTPRNVAAVPFLVWSEVSVGPPAVSFRPRWTRPIPNARPAPGRLRRSSGCRAASRRRATPRRLTVWDS